MQRFPFFVGVVFLLACSTVPAKAQDADNYFDRGNAWYDQGEYDKAIADFDQAIRLKPNFADVYVRRGNAWFHKGEYDKAIADYNQVLRVNPNDDVAYNNRGNAWDYKGEHDKAIADYNQVLRLNPNDAVAYNNRGEALRKKGEFDKALADYNQAIRLNPNYALAYNNLATIQATCPDGKYRDGRKALQNANKAYQLDGGKRWTYAGTLAEANAENGDFAKAREWGAKAIEMAGKDKTANAKVVEGFRAEIELFKQGKPYREEPKQNWQREAARAALIEMVKAGKHEELKIAVPNLRSAPIIAGDGDWISIGKWRVNMKDRSFVISLDAGPIFAEYSGKFTQGENGTWRAEITNETHN